MSLLPTRRLRAEASRLHAFPPQQVASEDVFEVLHAVCLEEHQQDQGPQAQDEAVRGVPVFLLRFLSGGGRRGKGGGEQRKILV